MSISACWMLAWGATDWVRRRAACVFVVIFPCWLVACLLRLRVARVSVWRLRERER